jgi:uncharacterized membrane protein YgcG
VNKVVCVLKHEIQPQEMPRIVAYIKEMLEEEKYSSTYIDKLPVRLKELNASQLHGMYTHLEKIKKGSRLKLWENANGSIMTKMEAELAEKQSVVDAKRKKREEELRKLREARAIERAKVVEAKRVIEHIVEQTREKAIKEVKDEEFKRKSNERIDLMKEIMKGEEKQKKLLYGGAAFLVIGIVVIAVATKVIYIIAAGVFFVVVIAGVIFYFAWRAPIFEPMVVTEEDIENRIDIRAEDLRLKAMNELKRQEEEHNARALREQQERRRIRHEKKLIREAEAVARLAELEESFARTMTPPVSVPVAEPVSVLSLAGQELIAGRFSPGGQRPLSAQPQQQDDNLATSQPAIRLLMDKSGKSKSVKFAGIPGPGSPSPAASPTRLQQEREAKIAAAAAAELVKRAKNSITSAEFKLDSIRFFNLDFIHELKMNLLGLVCLIENRSTGTRYISDITFYDDLIGLDKDGDVDFREEITEVNFYNLTEFNMDDVSADKTNYRPLNNEEFIEPVMMKFERMYLRRHGLPTPTASRYNKQFDDSNSITSGNDAHTAGNEMPSVLSSKSSKSSLHSDSGRKSDDGSVRSQGSGRSGKSGKSGKSGLSSVRSKAKSNKHSTKHSQKHSTKNAQSQKQSSSAAAASANGSIGLFGRLRRLIFGEPKIVPMEDNSDRSVLAEYASKSQRMKFTPKPVVHKMMGPMGTSNAMSGKRVGGLHIGGGGSVGSHGSEGQKWSIGTSTGGKLCSGINIIRDQTLKFSLYAIYHDLAPPHMMVHSVVSDYVMDLRDVLDGMVDNIAGLSNKNDLESANKKSFIRGDMRRINMFIRGTTLLTLTMKSIVSELPSPVPQSEPGKLLLDPNESTDDGDAVDNVAATHALAIEDGDGHPDGSGSSDSEENDIDPDHIRARPLSAEQESALHLQYLHINSLSMIDFHSMRLKIPANKSRAISYGRGFTVRLFAIVHCHPQGIEIRSEMSSNNLFTGIKLENENMMQLKVDGEDEDELGRKNTIDFKLNDYGMTLVTLPETEKITVFIYYKVKLEFEAEDTPTDEESRPASKQNTGRPGSKASGRPDSVNSNTSINSSNFLSARNEVLRDGSLLLGSFVCHPDDLVMNVGRPPSVNRSHSVDNDDDDNRPGQCKSALTGVILSNDFEPMCRIDISYTLLGNSDELV